MGVGERERVRKGKGRYGANSIKEKDFSGDRDGDLRLLPISILSLTPHSTCSTSSANQTLHAHYTPTCLLN